VRRLTDIDLRLIRIFRVIVECRGLTGAEAVLNLSQSRISASLAELEARLGVRLCQRGRAGFALSEVGAIIYEASHDLFEAADRFCNRAGAVAANLRRVLRLGTVDAIVSNPGLSLVSALRELRASVPTLYIDFTTAGPEELERQLAAGSRDVIIVPSFHKKKDFRYHWILDEKQSLYCARGHPLFERSDAEIAAGDLESTGFIARGYLHQFDVQRVGHHNVEATVETMEAQLVLILTGDYIGYLPAHYAHPWVRAGELRALADRALGYESKFYAVTEPNAAENPLLRRFLALIGKPPVSLQGSTRAS
jgi:LysR family transcriptional regulator, transcriptional activator for bauABCD operon